MRPSGCGEDEGIHLVCSASFCVHCTPAIVFSTHAHRLLTPVDVDRCLGQDSSRPSPSPPYLFSKLRVPMQS